MQRSFASSPMVGVASGGRVVFKRRAGFVLLRVMPTLGEPWGWGLGFRIQGVGSRVEGLAWRAGRGLEGRRLAKEVGRVMG